ncbi:MAG: hypothetical protein JO027_03070 [Solirubrobacterales bacterium]|nr:hypothetical protein [Solirubrobacterales bacterium]
MRRLAILLGVALVAGCGGSKSTSASSTPTAPLSTPLSSPPLTTPTQTSATETSVTLTQTAPEKTPTGAINVRVPARFTIAADGSVTPPTITIPAHLPVELIVVSKLQAHRVRLRTTTLTVPANRQAEALIDHLPVGSYPLFVDREPRALLVIGGAPGP